MNENKIIKAICILAGAIVSSKYSKHEYEQHKDVVDHANKFLEAINSEFR